MNYQTEDQKFFPQIYQVISISERLFPKQILGIYLYGSATLGRLRPDSDLDILIITNGELSPAAREHLTRDLSLISAPVGCAGRRPLEVTVINRNDMVPWQFPPKCEYMYGEWLREEIDSGKIPHPCHDPDITILLWQARTCSRTLKGSAAEKLIPPVSFREIRKAIQYSLPGLMDHFHGDERNVLLTLARMWFTLETGDISTKDIAAKWVLPKLPEASTPLLNLAKDAYLGNVPDDWQDIQEEAGRLASFMRREIERMLED